MPSVGRKRFPYTSAGKVAAKRYARKTGRPIRNTSGNRSGLENRGGSRMMRNPGMAPGPRRGAGPSPRKMRPSVGPGTGIGGGPRPLPRPRRSKPIIGRPPSNRLNRRNRKGY